MRSKVQAATCFARLIRPEPPGELYLGRGDAPADVGAEGGVGEGAPGMLMSMNNPALMPPPVVESHQLNWIVPIRDILGN